VVILLLTANAINRGADSGAMADAMALLLPGPHVLYILLFGADFPISSRSPSS
jgi:hypothetical protein